MTAHSGFFPFVCRFFFCTSPSFSVFLYASLFLFLSVCLSISVCLSLSRNKNEILPNFRRSMPTLSRRFNLKHRSTNCHLKIHTHLHFISILNFFSFSSEISLLFLSFSIPTLYSLNQDCVIYQHFPGCIVFILSLKKNPGLC